MSETPRREIGSLPVVLARQVDRVCDQLEAAWRAGRRPALEDFLAGVAAADRAALLAELIPLDAYYRRRQGEDPRPEDYLGRFPDLDRAWLARAVAAAPEPAPPAPVPAAPGRLRCPHCHNPIQLADDGPDEVLCPGCGSSFRVRDARPTTTVGTMRPLGKFQLLERVGVGAFGAVWKARDTALDRVVALKIPHAGLLAEPDELERFRREARAAAQLRHPGIVPVHEVVTLEGLPVLVADFIAGVPLKDLLAVRRLTFRETAELVAEVAEALDYAHSMAVVHRDVKPANILLDYGRPLTAGPSPPGGRGAGSEGLGVGKPLVMDFGLALRQEAEVTLTLEGHVLGTPAYMSPEQAAGHGHRVDRRSDVYSLGVVLYELLTGELPFRGSKAMLLLQVLREEPRPPRRLNEKIPRDLETVCLKALAKEPGRRYQTARDLADDLRRFLNGEPVLARPVSRVERLWRWSKRNPVIAGLGGAVLLLLLLVAVVASVGYVQTRLALSREAAEHAEANRQRGLAVDAEARAKDEAVRAQMAEDHSRRLWYAATMNLMQVAWEGADVRRFHELLAQTADFPDRGFEWYYWQRLSRLQHRALVGYQGSVRVVAFAPDSRRLATGGGDGTAWLWDATTGRHLFPLRGHRGEVTAVAFVPDGERLVTGSVDGTAKVWDLATCQALLNLPAHSPVWSVAVTRDGKQVVTGGEDGTARVWDLASGRELRKLEGHVGPVWSVAVTPDGQGVTGGEDGTARVWDLASGRELRKLEGHAGPIWSVAVTPDRQRIVTLIGGAVRVWNAVSGEEPLPPLKAAVGVFNAVAVSPDGRRVLTGAGLGAITLWDLATRQDLLSLKGHKLWVTSVAFSPDGKLLAAVAGGEARVWDTTGEGGALTLKGHKGRVTSVAVTADGKRVVSGSADGTVRLWDGDDGQPLRVFMDPAGGAGERALFIRGGPSVAVTPDGKWLVMGSGDGNARLWDTASDRSPRVLEGHGQPVICVAVTPDGRRVVAGSEDGTARVWGLDSGGEPQLLKVLKGQVGPLASVAVTPDGKQVVTGSADGTAWVWDLDSGREPRQFKGWDWFLWSAALTPDGRWLVAGGAYGTAKVWDLAGDRELHTIQAHSSAIISVAVTPDGRRLVTGGADGTAKVWDILSGRELLTLKGHTDRVSEVAVTPDGRKLVTGGWDGTAKVWEAASPEQVAAWVRQEQEAEQRRAAWQRPGTSAPGFIRDWLVLAPLPLEAGESGGQGLEREHIRGEALLRPRAGETAGDRERVWRAHHTEEAVLDFNRAVGQYSSRCVGYAVCYVVSDRERDDLLLQVGSDDEGKVYLNGREVYKHSRPRPLQELDPIGPVALRKGANVLVFKVVNGGGAWLGCARFVDREGNPAEGLRVTLSPGP